MLILQFTGLSGAGKSTLAEHLKNEMNAQGVLTEVFDGDVYRETLCRDLGFSRADRLENIRRLGEMASQSKGEISVISAINPYEEGRHLLKKRYHAKVIWIKCDLETLKARDTKGLYKRAVLPNNNPQKIHNLSGVNDPFEEPEAPHLVLNTAIYSIEECLMQLKVFIEREIAFPGKQNNFSFDL